MDVASPSSVVAAASAAPVSGQEEAASLALKKAIDLRASPAATLIQSLPQRPLLATSGAVGTQVDTFA